MARLTPVASTLTAVGKLLNRCDARVQKDREVSSFRRESCSFGGLFQVFGSHVGFVYSLS